jgi:hypothetical protein
VEGKGVGCRDFIGIIISAISAAQRSRAGIPEVDWVSLEVRVKHSTQTVALSVNLPLQGEQYPCPQDTPQEAVC